MHTLTKITLILSFTTLSVLSNLAFAQTETGKVWVTFLESESLPFKGDSGLTSNNSEIQQLINEFHIYKVEQAVPASRNEDLLKLYEVDCHCNWSELTEAMNKVNVLSSPEMGPEYELLYNPNDYNVVFANDYALDLINAHEAWDYSLGDTNVIIGVSDGNFYTNHEELTNKVVLNAAPPGGPIQYYHHGTAVATIAAGVTNNAVGKSSIGFNSKLSLTNLGYNQLLALSYSGVRVINVSWTSGCMSSNYIQNIINEIYMNGSIVIVAAGNGSTCGGANNLVYPAACNNVIAVSSVGPLNNHERTIGDPTTTHQHNSTVDVCAPGYDVALTVAPGSYLTGNGTSFASPYVAGTIGLMLAIRPCLTYEEAIFILQSTAFNLDSINPNYAGGLGAGRLHAGRALKLTYEMMPKIEANTVQVSCHGLNNGAIEANIESNGSYQYTWTSNNNTNMNANGLVQSNLTAGVYTLSVTDSTGCVVDTAFVISEPDSLILNSVVSSFPSGTNISCAGVNDGSIDLNLTGGTLPYTFDWTAIVGAGIVSAQEDQFNLTQGTYSVVVTDSNDCQYTDTINVLAPSVIVVDYLSSSFNSGHNVSCFGANDGTIDIVVNGGSGTYQYVWNTQNGSGLVLNSEDQQGLTNGEYSVNIIDANGCADSLQIVMSAPTELVVDIQILSDFFGKAVSCENNADGSISVAISGGTPGYNIEWSNFLNETNDTLTGLTQGQYVAIVHDANNCVVETTVVLEANPLPILNPDSPIETCLGSSVILSSNAVGNVTCNWAFSNGWNFTDNGDIELVMNQIGCLNATLSMTNEYGCTNSAFYEDYLCTYAAPEASFQTSTMDVSQMVNEVNFLNTSENATHYAWNFGDNETSSVEDPLHSFYIDGYTEGFDVTLYAYNEYGCFDSTSTKISVIQDLLLSVPNTFTPDGNEFNNTFKPVCGVEKSLLTYDLQVFNRWGAVVFESRDIAYGWDGTFNGSIAPEGTYIWKIAISTDDRVAADVRKNEYHGHVNIIR